MILYACYIRPSLKYNTQIHNGYNPYKLKTPTELNDLMRDISQHSKQVKTCMLLFDSFFCPFCSMTDMVSLTIRVIQKEQTGLT